MTQKQTPMIRPEVDYVDPFNLAREDVRFDRQHVIVDHYERFFMGRFKMLSSKEQSEFLAKIDAQLVRSKTLVDGQEPFQFGVMREKLGLAPERKITEKIAREFYLDYSDIGRRMWFSRAFRAPETQALAENQTFANLREQLPAIIFTLAHVWDGGTYGLLTARGGRDAHRMQMQLVGRVLGFAAAEELIYYVNDEKRGKRLAGGTGDRKAQALLNFATGSKFDEQGDLAPMTVGKPFDKILFTDDEDKNLKSVFQASLRDVVSSVLFESGLRHRSETDEQRISAKARTLMEREYAANGLRRYEDPAYWNEVVKEVLQAFHRQAKSSFKPEEMIERLRRMDQWIPDKVVPIDGRIIDVDACERRLRTRLADPTPLELGSKPVLLLNDIDGNLLNVQARFYVRRKGDEVSPPLLVFDQATWAENPNVDYWAKKVGAAEGLDPSILTVDFKHFRDQEAIEQDILRALHRNAAFLPPAHAAPK